jgi:hypothetical protein
MSTSKTKKVAANKSSAKKAAKKVVKKVARKSGEKHPSNQPEHYVQPKDDTIRGKLWEIFLKHKKDHKAAKEAAIKTKFHGELINPHTAAKQLWLMKQFGNKFASR